MSGKVVSETPEERACGGHGSLNGVVTNGRLEVTLEAGLSFLTQKASISAVSFLPNVKWRQNETLWLSTEVRKGLVLPFWLLNGLHALYPFHY